MIRIGHEETRRLLLRDDDPARPAPEETFTDRHTLEIGGERIELAWHGPNHTPDNIYIHLPDHDTLMLVDIVNAGWVPVYNVNLSEDVPGYIDAPATALSYPWKHFIGGHMGRLGTRDDVVGAPAVHRRHRRQRHGRRWASVDPAPYFVEVRREHLGCGQGLPGRGRALPRPRRSSRSTPACSPPPTSSPPARAFWLMESIRLDLGYGSLCSPMSAVEAAHGIVEVVVNARRHSE